MKLVIAIIKPFKLEDVRDALDGDRRPRHDRHRGQGLRPPEGPHRDLSRRRIRRELPAQDPHRGRGAGRPRRARWSRPSPTPPRPARSATARSSSPASITRCASAPARPTSTRSERSTATVTAKIRGARSGRRTNRQRARNVSTEGEIMSKIARRAWRCVLAAWRASPAFAEARRTRSTPPTPPG